MENFNSWREAYVAQQSSVKDETDPLWMMNFDTETGVEELDVMATTNAEIVWLVNVDDDGDGDQITQYGVGKNQKWYSIKFDNTGFVTTYIADSLKEFNQLPYLIESDERAMIIYKHIETLFEVYEFLANGKIEPDDFEDKSYLANAERIKAYAKTQEMPYFLTVEDEEEEEYTEEEQYDIDAYLDSLDEDEEEDDDSFYYNDLEDDEEDLEEDEEDFDLEDDIDSEIDFYDWGCQDENCQVCKGNFDEIDLEEEEPYIEEKENAYKFYFSNEREGEKASLIFEGTEEDSIYKFNELIETGYKFVEKLKMQSVYVSFQ